MKLRFWMALCTALLVVFTASTIWAQEAVVPTSVPKNLRKPAQLEKAAAAKNTLCYRSLGAFAPRQMTTLCGVTQLHASGAQSVLGTAILMQDVPASKTHAGKPATRVLVIGGIHGDEHSSVLLALKWIGLAEEIPTHAHWRFIPAVNPDGVLAKKPTRVNARGVDLNRNFPTPHWELEALPYWEKKTKKDPRRWPGNEAASQPESRFILEQIESFKPDLIVSIHAPYGVLDFDGPSVPPQKIGRLFLDQVGIYPGSLGNYAGIHRQTPVVTIELVHAVAAPKAAESRQMWVDLLRWMSERKI